MDKFDNFSALSDEIESLSKEIDRFEFKNDELVEKISTIEANLLKAERETGILYSYVFYSKNTILLVSLYNNS